MIEIKYLGPLKNGLDRTEEQYMINVLKDYFNEAFSSPALKKLIIFTHPHRKHLTGEYILDIKELIFSAKSESNLMKRLKLFLFIKI